MIDVRLTDSEQQLLQEILQSSQATLDVELHRTDNLVFKERLRERRDLIDRVLSKLSGPNATAIAA